MDQYGRSNKKMEPGQNREWPLYHVQQEAVSGLGLGGWGTETFPERSGVPNCINYMRTGGCAYGAKCNFNHPKDRNSFVKDVSLGGGSYPERVGEQECKFYLRTGTCFFGMKCRFHHPRNLLTEVPLNFYGYPLRPGEKECSYYMQTGLCKFGMGCKFHHPQPADSISMPQSAPTVYLMQSPSPPLIDPSGGAVFTNYKPPRPPLLVNPYVPIVSHPNWNAYQGVINPLPLRAKPGVESYLPFASSGSYMKQQKLPDDRPDQVQCCPYYMKNGVCNYGTSCKYHHPPVQVVTRMFCFLSPLGLPLRPGVQPCKFYLQNGRCKFGQNCRYDHPMEAMQYSPSSTTGGGGGGGGFLSVPYPTAEINFSRGQNRNPV